MHKMSFGDDIGKRLLRIGFARTYAERTAHELQEHWDDLIAEGMRSGLSEKDAASEASKRLGSVEDLASEISARMQRSSWLGRNPTFAFATLALMLTILWWVALGSALANFSGVFDGESGGVSKVPLKMELLRTSFDWIGATSYLVLPWICCIVAKRFLCGWRPALWACLVLALHNCFQIVRVTGNSAHGDISMGYYFNAGVGPALLPILVPLAVFALCRAWDLRDRTDNDHSGPTYC